MAQSQEPPFDLLKHDYKEVALVAHVRVEKAETVDSIPGYDKNRLSGEVVEPFKGALKKGQKIEFYSIADTGYPVENYLGEKIAFLNKQFDEKRKQHDFVVLENSLVKASTKVIANMRKIKSPRRRR